MQNFFLRLGLLFIFIILSNHLVAQTDSTQYISYDVVYLRSGGYLKGEILSFNENNGVLIFKGIDGKKYTFTTNDYSSYEEKVAFPVKKAFVLKPRKETGLEFHLGFSASLQNMNSSIQADDYFIEQDLGIGGYAMGIKGGVGNYLNRQNYIGASVEFGLNDYPKNFFSAGVRYFYQYDGYKRNVAFYLPIEAHFTSMKYDGNISTSDTNFVDGNGSWTYPSTVAYTSQFSCISLSVGQGVSFIMNNKKSIGIELSFAKYFVLSSRITGLKQEPNTSFSPNAIKLSLLYHI